MKRLDIDPGFIDESVEDLRERCFLWAYSLYAFLDRWELVLESKWMLASLSQGKASSGRTIMGPIKLQYLKGSKEKAHSFDPTRDGRMWNVLSPQIPGYTYDLGRIPTFGLEGLTEYGLLNKPQTK